MEQTLENRIIGIEQSITSLKASQFIGNGSYRVFQLPSFTVEHTLTSSSYVRYWIYYKGTTNFPLVSLTFNVWENGVKVTPMSSADVTKARTSVGTYWYSHNFDALIQNTGKTPPVSNDPTAFIVLLSMTGKYRETVNSRIQVSGTASCDGSFYMEAF